jgi:DNA-binding GntR family transcriptional regulator
MPENWSDALAEHEEVAQALKLRDSKRITKAIQIHFANTIKRVAL